MKGYRFENCKFVQGLLLLLLSLSLSLSLSLVIAIAVAGLRFGFTNRRYLTVTLTELI